METLLPLRRPSVTSPKGSGPTRDYMLLSGLSERNKEYRIKGALTGSQVWTESEGMPVSDKTSP